MHPAPSSWNADAEVLVLVPALVASYAVAVRLHPTERWRRLAFGGGVLLLAAAFATPLETLALHYLLTAHLLQNVVLAEWAPALLVLGLPSALAGRFAASRAGRLLTRPPVALPLWLVTYVVWHLPFAYDAALEHPGSLLHVEHLSYLAAGALVWWPVLRDEPRRLSAARKAGYLFAAFAGASPLGLVLALLAAPAYGFYERAPGLWGLGHLADQQLAGVTMAAEQAVVFLAVLVHFAARALRESGGGPAGAPT